tara:strand:+ start:29 stop:895 length:867 start_codon:yes stop_codon:yes gene_type:complete
MNIIKKIRQAAIAFAGILSTPFGKTLEKKFGYIIDETPTKYDLKIDEEYIKTGIGGFTHRHFDDHSFLSMWEKVKETLPNDTKFEEIKNYFISLSKDLQTPMGIPLHKINDKETYDQFASYMSKHFAIKKSWLLDIQSVNLAEVFGATIGVVALLFGWKKSEKEEFADLASSLVVAGAFGANPILLIVSLVSLAKSYTKDKNKNKFKKGTLRGVLGMGSFIMTASLFSSPIIGIIIGLIVAISVKKSLKKIDLSEIYEWFKENVKKYGSIIIETTGIEKLSNKIKNLV